MENMNERQSENVMKAYETIGSWLDGNRLKYEKHEDQLYYESWFSGNDLKMRYKIQVVADREIIKYVSVLPFNVPKEKAIDMAIAICAINNKLISGCFIYDMESNSLYFKMTTSFAGCSTVTEDMVSFMIIAATRTVDDYNDKLFMLSQGVIGYTDFIE